MAILPQFLNRQRNPLALFFDRRAFARKLREAAGDVFRNHQQAGVFLIGLRWQGRLALRQTFSQDAEVFVIFDLKLIPVEDQQRNGLARQRES